MTIMPMWKRCRHCGRIYDRNPDVGIISCPYCREKDIRRLERLKKILHRDRKNDSKDLK